MAPTSLCSVSMSLTIVRTSYQWNSCQWKWGSSMESQGKHFRGPHVGGWGVAVWIIGLDIKDSPRLPVSHLHLSTVEEVQPCLHQAQKKSQGPEILCHQFSPCQILVQFSLCPHPDSLVCFQLHSGWCCITTPRPTLGAHAAGQHGCYRENVQTNGQMNACYRERRLSFDCITSVSGKKGFHTNQSLSQFWCPSP